MAHPIGAPRELSADFALAVAVGMALLGRPTEEDRLKLATAVTAARVSPVGGRVSALADAAEGWLAGTVGLVALSDALHAFTNLYVAPRRASHRPAEPDHRGLIEGDAPLLSHAARVAAAMEESDHE